MNGRSQMSDLDQAVEPTPQARLDANRAEVPVDPHTECADLQAEGTLEAESGENGRRATRKELPDPSTRTERPPQTQESRSRRLTYLDQRPRKLAR